MPALGGVGDAGGQVDGRPEPVAAPPNGRPGVDADPHPGEAMPSTDPPHELHPQPQALGGVLAAQHERVTDALDPLGPAGVQALAREGAELLDDDGGGIVPVRLGQRRVTREVGEDEGVARVGHRRRSYSL